MQTMGMVSQYLECIGERSQDDKILGGSWPRIHLCTHVLCRMSLWLVLLTISGVQGSKPPTRYEVSPSVDITQLKQEVTDSGDEDMIGIAAELAADMTAAENDFGVTSADRMEASTVARYGNIAQSAATSQARQQVQEVTTML